MRETQSSQERNDRSYYRRLDLAMVALEEGRGSLHQVISAAKENSKKAKTALRLAIDLRVGQENPEIVRSFEIQEELIRVVQGRLDAFISSLEVGNVVAARRELNGIRAAMWDFTAEGDRYEAMCKANNLDTQGRPAKDRRPPPTQVTTTTADHERVQRSAESHEE